MKKTLLLLMLTLMGLSVMAKPVNPDRAVQIAKNFVAQYVKGAENFTAALVYTHLMPKSGQPAMYAVNVGSSFVIVSANDIAHPVLGYSLSRPWPEQTLPAQVAAYLDDLAAQIETATGQQENPDRETTEEWHQLLSLDAHQLTTTNLPDSIGPLLTTTWDQGLYYNALCPEDASGPAGHVYTGCVATAMAQIVNYWGYPLHGRGIHSYQSNYGTLTVNYDSATYDYAHMPNALTATSTTQEVNAVATLMRDCGVAVNMEYGPTESGAYDADARAGFINFFRLNSNLSYVEKKNYTTTEWESLLLSDIAAGQPIYYGGYGSGGHAFVCDGYNDSSYFHFNFGWSGFADGWYLTTAVNPAGMDFNSGQDALLGIFPDSTGTVILGQTFGHSTYTVNEPLLFLNPLYSDYYDWFGGNTVTFISSNDTTNLICDVTEFDESVIQYINVINSNATYFNVTNGTATICRSLSYNDFGSNDYSTIETNSNAVTFDFMGNYNGYNSFGFYVHKDDGCRMVPSFSLNNVNDDNGISVRVEWVDSNSTGPWQIKYRPYGAPLDSATIINVTTNPYYIFGLSTGKLYYFSVRNQCGIDANVWNVERGTIFDIPRWIDIVTAQPIGYTEDTNGNVEISSAEGLAWLSVKTNGLHNQTKDDYSNKRVCITSDINLDGYRWYPIAAPAVHSGAAFRGVFDGNNHVISNIKITEDKTQKCGLFAVFEGDTIKNVILSNGVIHNLFYNVLEQSNSGGLVGKCIGGAGLIENCHAAVDVYGVYSVGALCGETYGKIINCSSSGNVYGREMFGGLLGHAGPGSEIKNCYSTGNVLSNIYVTPVDCIYGLIHRGGLIGYAENSNIENCYAIGNVETETGGLFCGTLFGGTHYNTIIRLLFSLPNANLGMNGDNDNSTTLSDVSVFTLCNDTCQLATLVSVSGVEYTDMVAAMNARIVETNDPSFKLWVKDTLNINGGYPVFGDYYEPSCYNPTNLTVSQATIVGDSTIRTEFAWNQVGEPISWELLYVTSRRSIDEGTIIPINSNPCVLNNIPVGNPLDFYIRAVCGNGDTSEWSNPVTYIPDKLYWTDVVTSQPNGYQEDIDGTIHIYSAEGLAWLSKISINSYEVRTVFLESDVDMGQYRWQPICDINHSFDGAFDGKGHTISNLYCNDLKDNLGLFGYIGTGSIIKNVNVYNCYMAGTSYVSAITANAWDCEIINCGASGELHAWGVAAGIVSDAPFSTVRNSFFNGSIVYREDMYCYLIPGYFGGVANHVETIENCYFSGDIPNMDYCGLITFTGNTVDTINNCYSLFNESNLPFTINIPANNLSYFTGSGNTWTLSIPSFINGISYLNLVNALNAWVDANDTAGIYRHWAADSANVNGGFPVFAAIPCTPATGSDSITVCDSYPWQGTVYTADAVLVDTLSTLAGCDSIVTHYLTVKHSTTDTETATACESYFWDGQWLVASGLYVDTLTNAAGCDSIVTLTLTINNPVHIATTETACDSYTWNGATLNTSGDYTYPHNDANGCTQVDTLHLTINNPVHTAVTVAACESYSWNDTVYTASGAYTYTHLDSNGCTQVDTLYLTITTPVMLEVYDTACDVYSWYGNTYTATGDYVRTRPSMLPELCDTVETLHLTINYSAETTITDTAEGSYTWNGETYTESGTYQWQGTTDAGCDSTVTLLLVVNSVGIEVIDGSRISVVVYPNPTTGWVTIDAEDILSVEVFDQAGHKVATYEQSNRINLGELAAGNYILRIHLQRGSSVQRVILK